MRRLRGRCPRAPWPAASDRAPFVSPAPEPTQSIRTRSFLHREFVFGIEREVLPNTTARCSLHQPQYPADPRDVANCPSVGYVPRRRPVSAATSMILTNPSSATPINPAAIARSLFAAVSLPTRCTIRRGRTHVEPTAGEQLVDASPRIAGRGFAATSKASIARITANRIRAFHRSTTSRPTIRPTHLSECALGYPGDIRYLNDPNGILPLDRPNQGKLFGNYVFPWGLNLGLE